MIMIIQYFGDKYYVDYYWDYKVNIIQQKKLEIGDLYQIMVLLEIFVSNFIF